LDSTTKRRIQRQIDLGHYREPAEVVAHALALLDHQAEWAQRGKELLAILDKAPDHAPNTGDEL
jgi:hypothetical protein